MWAGNSTSIFGVTLLRLSRCCSTLKDCTRPSRSTSNSPSTAPVEIDGLDHVGEAAGDVLAGARVEPRHVLPVRPAPADRLHADAVPLPLGEHHLGVELVEIAVLDARGPAWAGGTARDRSASGRWRGPRPRRTAPRKAAPARARPPRCRPARRRRARPRALLARRAETPIRRRAGDQLQQRPAAGLVQRVEPAREQARQVVRGGSPAAPPPLRRGRALRSRPALAGQSSATVSERSPT